MDRYEEKPDPPRVSPAAGLVFLRCHRFLGFCFLLSVIERRYTTESGEMAEIDLHFINELISVRQNQPAAGGGHRQSKGATGSVPPLIEAAS